MLVARMLRGRNVLVVFTEWKWCERPCCLWSPDLCPPHLQMKPTRMSLLDRSTISCPGNKAASSSDSKSTCFDLSETVLDPENVIPALQMTCIKTPRYISLQKYSHLCWTRLLLIILLGQKCYGPKRMCMSSPTWAAAVITCSVFCFLWYTQRAKGSLVIMSANSTVCV